MMLEPSAAYLALLRTGELARRVAALHELARECRLCPEECRSARHAGAHGHCGASESVSVMSFGPHHGEERIISGSRGSGTIFFGHCNLHCIFCQNSDISQNHMEARRREVDADDLALIMLHVQELGCHNINLVSPSHYTHAIACATEIAAHSGLNLPLVYNTNAYDSLETLRQLDGVVDIYMPDLKYSDNGVAEQLSGVAGYVDAARAAIAAMHSQVGNIVLNDEGVALRGVLIRHLVLPYDLAGSRASLDWIAQALGLGVSINLMSQYRPAYRAALDERVTRPITRDEYRSVVEHARALGFTNLIVDRY